MFSYKSINLSKHLSHLNSLCSNSKFLLFISLFLLIDCLYSPINIGDQSTDKYRFIVHDIRRIRPDNDDQIHKYKS